MATFEVKTKVDIDEECYFLLFGAVCKGVVKHIQVYINPKDYVPCPIEEMDADLIDITPMVGESDFSKPQIEYLIQVDHPVLNNQKIGMQRLTQNRVFRSAKTLIDSLQKQYLKAYETSI